MTTQTTEGTKMATQSNNYHYSAQIVDFEAGTIIVTERAGLYATSGDAVLQIDHRLSDAEIETWLTAEANENWAAPTDRDYDDLTITIERA